MKDYSFTILRKDQEALATWLIRPDGLEHAAYLLCNESRIEIDPWDRVGRRSFLVSEVIPVRDEDVVAASAAHITWATEGFVRVLKQAQNQDQIVAIAHNHTGGELGFSDQDDANEPDLVRLAVNRNGEGTELLSLVMTQGEDLAGRVWLRPDRAVPLRMIRVVGDRFRFHYPGRGTGVEREALDRQALAFGSALNDDLRELRVGVVGCGGTGSAVATMLARLGVGQLLLIDNDVVETTNLNRLHGATQSDADAMLPKVNACARSIVNMGLGVRVATMNAWVGDRACRDALLSCDVIFGCTDDHDGRLLLNRLAYYYLIPVIDAGLAIEVRGSPPKIVALDGRVTVLLPGYSCLMCRGVVDPRIASSEALRRADPSEFERRKAEAYVIGEGNPSPAVVTFTTEVACMAINELIHRLQGFRGEDGDAANRLRKLHQGREHKAGHPSRPVCPVCGTGDIWGSGDVEPFLGRVG